MGCVQLFDRASTLVRTWSFPTGYRNVLKDASFDYSSDLDTDVLVIRTAQVINGRDVAAEYFAVGDDNLRLVRLEDSKGSVVQNMYHPEAAIGVKPSVQSIEEWTDLLRSMDKSDVLSALVFLGGEHPGYEPLFADLVYTKGVRDLIEQLTHSNNQWIREAAYLAWSGPPKHRVR